MIWRTLVLALCLLMTPLGSAQAQRSPRRQAAIEVLLTRATWLVDNRRPDRALSLLRKAMQRAPHDPTPVAHFAHLALPHVDDPLATQPTDAIQRDAQVVLEAIEQVALRDDSGVGERADRLFAEQIWALVFAQSLNAAIDAWQKRAVLLSRDHAELGRKLATLTVHRGDLAAAQAVLEACVRINGEDHTLRSDLGAVALARGRVRDALVWFREVAVADPQSLNAQRDLAGALLASGDALTAMGLLRHRRDCEADCDCALELTRAAITATDYNVAIAAAGRHALPHCDANDPEPALWLAIAEQQAGHTNQARAAYRLALRRDPESERAREGLRTLETNPSPAN